MGKIKKILENELVGGTQTTDVYPVTSVKAVYDENNERLDHILARRGVVNASTNYNDDHIVEVLTLDQAIAKVPSSDRTLGFVMTFLTSDGWKTYQFNGDSLSDWGDNDKWESFTYTSSIQNLQYLIDRFYGSLVESGTNLLSTPYPGYVDTSGNIIAYPNDVASYHVYPAVPILEDITYKYSGKISDDTVYAVAFYSFKGELMGGLRRDSLINDYTEGTIKAPKGAVFAIVSTKDTYKASLSPSESYYNNHISNVHEQIDESMNTVRAGVEKFNGREFQAEEELLGQLTPHTYVQLSDGMISYNVPQTYYHTSSLIPVKGGEEYNYIGSVFDSNVAGIAFYTGSLKFIKGYGKDDIHNLEVFTVTAPDNAVYALVCSHDKNFEKFRFYTANSYYVLSKIKEVQDTQQDIQQDNYPYGDGVRNIVSSLPKDVITSSNVRATLITTGMFIEPKAVEVTIGTPLPNSEVWNYYYAKSVGVFPAGKYVAFIRAKRVGTSTCRLQVYSNTGASYAHKDITNELSEEYQLFSVNCELTDETNNVFVGVSAMYSFNGVTEGDKIYLSVIGFAKNRTEKSIGSDIYTINDILELNRINSDWNINYEASMAIFQGIPSVGMIGDSLMSGATYNHYDSSNPFKDREGCEWWRVLERESGAKYLDFAAGGIHTRSWLETFLNKATQEENRCCAYIIGLGVNDAYALGDSYLGSQSDIDLDNPDNNGDTYYGNYAKIIQKLTAFNGRAKFFLLTEPRKTGDSDDKWNGAIRYIANLFDNCYLVDLQDMYNNTYTSGFINDTKGPQAHYPYITYCYTAKLIERAIGKVIMDNARDFVDIQFAAET